MAPLNASDDAAVNSELSPHNLKVRGILFSEMAQNDWNPAPPPPSYPPAGQRSCVDTFYFADVCVWVPGYEYIYYA